MSSSSRLQAVVETAHRQEPFRLNCKKALGDPAMSITLKPEQTQFIQQQIAAGRFKSEGEVLEKALQLLDDQYREYEAWAEDIRSKVDEAQAEIDRGEGIPLDIAMAQLQERFHTMINVEQAQKNQGAIDLLDSWMGDSEEASEHQQAWDCLKTVLI
jgi:antitoxin ParD1/3/4